MRGIIIKEGSQLIIETENEEWFQGSEIKGTFQIIGDYCNENLKLALCYGNSSKLKKKDKNAFKIIDTSELTPLVNNSMNFSFQLSSNCEISESTGSPYLVLFENEEDLFWGQQLALKINPHSVISSFIQVMENFYRFKIKTFKNKKGWLEGKVIVPESKDLSSVVQLNTLFKMDDSQLNIKYNFKLKKVNYENGLMETQDDQKTIDLSLTEKDYQYGKDAPNQDNICKIIETVIDEIRVRPIV